MNTKGTAVHRGMMESLTILLYVHTMHWHNWREGENFFLKHQKF